MDVVDTSRARRLRAGTGDMHERLDRRINAAAAFDSVAAYGRFVQMQWVFHAEIAPLYRDADLQRVLPGLAARQRLALVAEDLADLDLAPAVEPAARFTAGRIDIAAALGWLYVAEGSNMGAALLRKAAARLGLSDGHGGRHLAPAAEGPAAQWRIFTAALDAAELDSAGEERAVQGARAAFSRVERLAELHIA
ncbi:biliverdin-producing heme oxygenase [Croceibacterium ferulae]|uniref:biliverdin-producing heme oxygenase n=1 Tax=Croceibacterium ferulae TaxID=1854641 RepID=UPI000EB1401B|nr:biliverdin-producing heme oxygenase [Croceibacterium ferulae]